MRFLQNRHHPSGLLRTGTIPTRKPVQRPPVPRGDGSLLELVGVALTMAAFMAVAMF